MKLFRFSHHHPSDCFCLGRKQKELCSMWSPEKWIWMETRMSRLEGKVRQGQWEATEEGKVGGRDRPGAAGGTSVNQHLLYGSGSWVLCWTHPFFLEEKMQFSPRAVFCQLNESGLLEPDYFLLMCLYFLFPRRCFPKPQSAPSQSQLLLFIGWSSASSWKILLGRVWEGSLLGWSFGPEPEDQGAVWSSTSALLPFCPEEVYPVTF